LHLEHKPSDETDLLISAVNEADLGWKADVCKYQKSNSKYGGATCEKPLMLAQVKEDDDENIQEETDGPKQKEFGV